jgi:hypothetical protein
MRNVTGSIGLFAAVLLLGCSGAVPNSSSTPATPAVRGVEGVVHGGQAPITGAAITLWAAGASGDGSAALRT